MHRMIITHIRQEALILRVEAHTLDLTGKAVLELVKGPPTLPLKENLFLNGLKFRGRTLMWLSTTVTGGVIFLWGWGCITVDMTFEFGPTPALNENNNKKKKQGNHKLYFTG